jgi:hypothetical protein
MTNKKESPKKNVETIETFTPKTLDFKHRCADIPQNNVIHASCQLNTILQFLYPLLEPAKMPEVSLSMIDDMHRNHEHLKSEVLDALFIIDSLNSDILVIAQAMD